MRGPRFLLSSDIIKMVWEVPQSGSFWRKEIVMYPTFGRVRRPSIPVFVRETPVLEGGFVRKDTFDARVDGMKVELKGDIAIVRRELSETKTELKGDIHSLRTELKGDMDNLRTELKGDIDKLHTELKGDMDSLRTELKGDMDNLRTELKGDISGLRAELKGDIKALDERLDHAVDSISIGFRALDARIEATNTRFDDMQKNRSHDLALVSIIVSVIVSIAVPVVQIILQNIWK